MAAQDFLGGPQTSARTVEGLGGPTPQTPTPAPASPAPESSGPKISPGERDYLFAQGRKILGSGGSEADFANFVQTHVGMPLGARVGAVTGNISEVGGDSLTEDNFVSGMSLNALQGVTFGFGDEAVGGLLGVLTGEGAAGGRESYRARIGAWNANNQNKAFIAEILGGFLTGAGTARAAGAGARALGTGGRLGVAAAEGAISGSLYAMGNAEGTISDRSKAAMLGGAAGAVMGPAAVGVFRGAGSVLKPATRGVLDRMKNLQGRIPGLGSSADHAAHFYLEAMEAEGLSVSDLRNAANALRAQGVDATLADLGGDGTLHLMSETTSGSSPAIQQLREGIMSRQAEQGGRLSGGLFARVNRLTNFGLENAYTAVDNLRSARRAAADPLYAQAYQEVLPTNSRMQEILGHPKLREAWAEGIRIAQGEELAGIGHGLAIPDLPAPGAGGGLRDRLAAAGVAPDAIERAVAQAPAELQGASFPTSLPIRGLDYMKRGLDAVIKRGLVAEGMGPKEASTLRALLEETLTMADDAVESYGNARAVWGGTTQAMEAVELGQLFMRKPAPIIQREMAALMEKSPGLADFYRLGATQAIYEATTGTASRNEGADMARKFFGGRLFGAPNQDAMRIQALFPDAPEVAEDFMRQIAAETRISETASRVRGGSARGAVQEFEQAIEGSPPNIRMTPQLTILGAMHGGLMRAKRAFRGQVNDELATMFTQGVDSPSDLDLLFDKLEYSDMRRIAQRKFGRQLESGLVASLELVSGKVFGGATR